ncbi:MAG: YdbL family protein [Gammaproteobacteria bacterium]
MTASMQIKAYAQPFTKGLLAALALFLAGCVTVNIYFPAAAAEKAADRIIQDVWGDKPAADGDKTSGQSGDQQHGFDARHLALRLMDLVFTPAHAQADINISTPAIQGIKQRMKARHAKLEPLYQSGAVGLTNQGTVAIRDMAAVPLKSRRDARSLVSDENNDRGSLYAEIARANGHPEWEGQIRQTFSKRWIKNAGKGWWYQDGSGNWVQ